MNRALIPTVLVLLLGPGEARAQSTPKQAAAEGAPQPAAAASAVTPAGSSAVDLPSLRISITSANDSRTDDGKGNLLAVLSIAGESPFSANTLIRRVAAAPGGRAAYALRQRPRRHQGHPLPHRGFQAPLTP